MVEGERGGEGDEREGKGEVKVKGKKGGKERETRGDRRQEAQLLRTVIKGTIYVHLSHLLCPFCPPSPPPTRCRVSH